MRKPENTIGLYDPAYEHDNCGVGFLCDLKGKKSNKIVLQGLEILRRLAHRGATGADPKTGDGAGILIQLPHAFFSAVTSFELPPAGDYGTGLVFLPTEAKERTYCKEQFAAIIAAEDGELLGWREVPVDNKEIGHSARETEPVIEQVFIKKGQGDQLAFERKLFVIRKRVENTIRGSQLKQRSFFYIPSLSSRTFVYKGLLMPEQVDQFFPDLRDERIESALVLVHSRYSTNTFPTWDLAQPFRFLAHNGEINTLRGNINWMAAKESLLASPLLGEDLKKILPVIVQGGSDSATFDNVFELLLLSGRSLPHVMMMMIPAAWEQHRQMAPEIKDFYRYHAAFMEPWDGPAAMAVTDGTRIAAALDRNGLRPARYILTKDGIVALASEVGVLDIPPSKIEVSGRLEPGKIFYVDTEKGKIFQDEEVKKDIASRQPYGKWIADNLVDLTELPAAGKSEKLTDILTSLKAFGYSREDLKVIIKPMAETGKEPVGSMGNDAPHAVLSNNPQLLYAYFKQLFAQVTNPPIDFIREEMVMSLDSFVGPQQNLLAETPEHVHRLYVKEPVLTNEDLEKVRAIKKNGFKTKTISILFKVDEPRAFRQRLDAICAETAKAIDEGYSFVILSDRGVDEEQAAIPALLATGAVHHHLVRQTLRSRLGIIIESAEPREVHHFALLFGYGADSINPYLAYDSLDLLIAEKELPIDRAKAVEQYRHAVNLGILKILSKMGISTLQSYRGAQIFEALGVGPEVIEKCFTGTASRIGGVGFDEIAKEAVLRHYQGYPKNGVNLPYLISGGLYQWKKDGEFHLWNPDSIAALQDSVRKEDYARFKEFAALINDQSKQPTTLRGLLKFKETTPIAIEQVEPIEQIFKRLATGAMSFGSISRGAHESLAIAMNRLGGRSNTGEGGEDPARFTPLPNGDSKRSAIKQVASGRFGVTTNYLVNADEIQIKIAQGAKPGEGGQLPGHKVSAIIAKTRYTTPGVTLISPPPHHDIYSIEDLAQLIFDLKNTNPSARISVKLVSEVGVGTVAAGVAKGHADMILISGGDGGTGASPISSIKNAGLPWELGLSETHQTLVLNDLRSRVRLQTDGQMRTGRDVAIAALLGAEEYGFCTSALIVMGCVMLRHCHLNNCSLGVATQDELLEKRFRGQPEYVVTYFNFIARELREIMAQLGVRTIDEMVGRTDLLELNQAIVPWKAQKIDYSKILYRPEAPKNVKTRCVIAQDHGVDKVLDRELIKQAQPALEKRQEVAIEMPISNVNRTTGAMLSGEVCKRFGEDGLAEETIKVKFKGVAGQSFGAWLAKGITFELEGLANDYVGKGISGGKIIIYPDSKATYQADKNSLIGNTTFYGAISGEAYISGMAGERFCIRNSGLYGVVEGVGDHGCEYMTGGRVVILGRTGRNFGAGMSGGIAYVYDESGDFKDKCNFEMIELQKPNQDDFEMIKTLVANHVRHTKSEKGAAVLENLKKEIGKFVKVMPLEYKRIIEEKNTDEKLDLTEVADG